MNTFTAVFFGDAAAGPRSRRPLSPMAWTLLGTMAIPLWATWPALSLKTRSIPPLECLAIFFLVSWLALACLERRAPHAASSDAGRQSWIPAVAFALGEGGSAVFFLLSTHYIAADEANLGLR